MNRYSLGFALVLAALSAAGTSAQINPAGPACVEQGIVCNVSFQASSLGVGSGPSSIAVADFGNGNLDLAVVNANDNTVSILLGKGDGTFAAPTNYTVNNNFNTLCTTGCSSFAIAIAVGDFNGDGKPDLAITNIPINDGCKLSSLFGNVCSSVAILFGDGDGTFQPANQVSLNGHLPTSVAVSDFNNDQKQDLAITNLNSNNVEILLGNGDGTFQEAPNSPFSAGVGNQPISVAVGDFNAQGNQDLAVANAGDGTISILLGGGDGTFVQQPIQSTITVGVRPVFVAVANLVTGAVPALVVANLSSSTISVLYGNGDGTFATPATYGVGAYPSSIAVGDFNNDGKPDLAVVNRLSNSVSMLINIGSGFFQHATNVPVGSNPQSIAVGNFNGGNSPGLAIANATSNTVSVLLNLGNATNPPPTFPVTSLPSPVNFTSVAVPGGGSSSTEIMVQNTGTAFLAIYSILILPDSGTPAGTFTETTSPIDDCQRGGTNPSSFCYISLTFTPGAVGPFGATLELVDNVFGGSTTTQLSGAGVAPYPVATLTPNGTVQLGTIQQGGSGSPVAIQVQNLGTANLVLGNLSVIASSGSASDISTSGDTCSGTTIQVYSSCQISLTFAPTSVPGTQDTLILTIPDNAPDTPQEVTFQGTSGTPPTPPTSLPVLVSVNDVVPSAPANAGNGSSASMGIAASAVSSGGQYVAFASDATNLPGPQTSTQGISSVYLRTVCPQELGCVPVTKFISYGPTSGPNANGGAPCNLNTAYIGAAAPAIDTTGLFVAFVSDACVPRGATPETQIYLRNGIFNNTSLVSLDDNGNPLNNGVGGYSMSANARYFAYSSSSANVAGLTTNFVSQVFLRDVTCTPPATTCTPTTLISQEPNGNPAPSTGSVGLDFMSPDGRYVVFSSSDPNMANVPPTSFSSDAQVIYMRDTCNPVAGIALGTCVPTTKVISVDSTGNAVSGGGAVVANGGRYIIFSSSACSLSPRGCIGTSLQEVYLADTCTYYGSPVQGCTAAAPKLISVDQYGNPDTFLYTGGPDAMTPDGRLALLTSYNPLLANVSAQAIYAYDTCTSNAVPVTTACTTGLHLVSADSSGAAFGNGSTALYNGSGSASVDATGQFVSFGTDGDIVTAQNPMPMGGGVYLGLTSGVAGTPGSLAMATISPTQLNFSSVALGMTPTQTVELSSTGTSPLILQLVGWVGGVAAGFSNTQITCDSFSGSVASLPAGFTLNPGQNCYFTIQFDPTAVYGYAGGFVFEDNAGPGQSNLTSTAVGGSTTVFAQVVPVSGTGAGPIATFSQSSVSFPSAVLDQTSTSQSLTLTNTGTAPLVLTLAYVTPDNFVSSGAIGGGGPNSAPFAYSGNNITCGGAPVSFIPAPITINPNASCVFPLLFDPTDGNISATEQTVSQSDTIIFDDNSSSSNAPNVLNYPNTQNYTQTITVSGTVLFGVSVQLSSSAPSAVFGTPVTVMAGVMPLSTNKPLVNPTGTVTFLSGQGTLGSSPIVAGVATLMTSSIPVGTYNVTANYGGDSNYVAEPAAANGAMTALTVTKAGSSIALGSSAGTMTVATGSPVTITATVSSATTGTPSGTVTFMNGSTALGQPAAVGLSGMAVLITSALPAGMDSVTAIYSGDSNFTGSTTATPVSVSVANPDYMLAANPSSLTITAPGSASTTITITPTATTPPFSGAVSISCGIPPSYIICTFVPPSPITVNGATNVQLTVQVLATAKLELHQPFFFAMIAPLGLLGLMLKGKGNRRRRMFYAGMVLLIVSVAGTIVGCTGSPTSNLPPAGMQPFVISTTASGGIVHPLNLTITITN